MRRSSASLLLSTLLALLAFAPVAGAQASSPALVAAAPGGASAVASGFAPPLALGRSRYGGGFGRSSRSPFGTRRRSTPFNRRPYGRRRSRGFGSSLLRAIGFAWLASALFGWGGGGGSPFGLIIVLLLVWMILRSLRPRRRYTAY